MIKFLLCCIVTRACYPATAGLVLASQYGVCQRMAVTHYDSFFCLGVRCGLSHLCTEQKSLSSLCLNTPHDVSVHHVCTLLLLSLLFITIYQVLVFRELPSPPTPCPTCFSVCPVHALRRISKLVSQQGLIIVA